MQKVFQTPRALFALAFLLLPAVAAKAQTSAAQTGFGLGAIVGEPTGVSASLPTGPNTAFNGLVGYEFARDHNLTVLADYVWHHRGLIPVEPGDVSFYAGPGARLSLGRETEAGVRAVLGVDYTFDNAPVQLLLEVCPGINVVPNTLPHTTAGIGARFFF
jgi:hypothetical protein